jgi:hypothetical protein
LLYGLSPAIVLARAARGLARNGSLALYFPPELSRSKLIRTLSVFAYQLESISGPGEPNYDICVQASKAISRTLEELLNPSPIHLDLTSTPAQLVDLENFKLSLVGSDALDVNIWDGFDSFDWPSSVDMRGEWAMS